MYHQDDNTITTEEARLDENDLGGIGDMIFCYMNKHSGKIAQIDVATGETDTFDHLLQRCVRTSIVFQKTGIKQGDIITYYSNIHMNAGVPIVASFFIGAISSFIDASLPSLEVTHLLKQVTPKLLITDRQYLETIKNIVINADIVTQILAFDEEFFKYQEEEATFKPIWVKDLHELAVIYFSSGSTGFPKGICLNHYQFLHLEIVEEEGPGKDEQKVNLSYDSFYWTVELKRFLRSIKEGACRLISSDKFDPKKIWYILEKYKVNIAYLIPFDLTRMCRVEKPRNINLTSFTTLHPEGAPLPKIYELALREMLPGTNVLQFYGQTEAGVLLRFSKSDLHQTYNNKKLGCAGVPINGVSYKIVDMKTGKNLGPNQQGELLVKSKVVMLGYHNQDSSEQFDEDGWLKTGDIAYYDQDLCFFITGRIKELILYQGWHVTPASLEAELLNYPAVTMAVVIGVPHIEDGERPLGLVMVKDEVNASAEDIEEYVKMKIPERPMTVKIIKEIPMTTNGKVRRQELKRRFLEGIL